MPWSRKSRSIHLLPLWPVRSVQSLSACTRVHFTLPITSNTTHAFYMFRPFLRPSSDMSIQKSDKGRYNKIKKSKRPLFTDLCVDGESNGKLPPRTCPGCSVPEPYRSHDWALVPAKPGFQGWILMNEWNYKDHQNFKYDFDNELSHIYSTFLEILILMDHYGHMYKHYWNNFHHFCVYILMQEVCRALSVASGGCWRKLMARLDISVRPLQHNFK